jgi:membrane fusion protein (multidrug efflux system)
MLLILCACQARQTAPPEPVPAVRVGVLQPQRRPARVRLSGTVESPAGRPQAGFLVSGRVVWVGPREGDAVTAGQPLARLDAVPFQLAVDAAQAQCGVAEVAARRAADQSRRMQQLYDNRSLAANDFLQYDANRETTARQWEQAQVAVRLASRNLADACLNSPLTGFVARRAIEPGDLATPGRLAFELVQLDPVGIHVGVPERDLGRVRPGAAAHLVVPALDSAAFVGRVSAVNVAADPATRTFTARLQVANPEYRLRLGMVAIAEVLGSAPRPVIAVPLNALARDIQDASIVYVYQADTRTVHARAVTTGTVTGDEVEIEHGLAGTETVVLAGQHAVRDGMVVEVVP